jgi:hypothetical protein
MTVKYLIGHWTGGQYLPNKIDLTHYQLLIGKDGETYKGVAQGCTSSTGGMNSITYNIACCGGLSTTKLTPTQIEKFFNECAKILKAYGLKPEHFYTHAEIGEMTRGYKLKIKGLPYDAKHEIITDLLQYNSYLDANIGKIDLTILPYVSGNAFKTGDFIRSKINWYFTKLN